MTKKTVSLLLILTGTVLLLAAAVLWTLQWQESRIAGENARKLLEETMTVIRQEKETHMYDPAVTETPAGRMPRTTLSGYDLVGVVRISSVHVELPVLSTWDYDLLKISPCRYSGSLETDDLILLGHNYVTHFAPLRRAQVGDRVEFCDVQGVWHNFTVAETEVLKATELDRLTGSAYPLTIFTCTRDGVSRFVLRCEYEK